MTQNTPKGEGTLLSNCCNAIMEVNTADEGTSHWICMKCGKPCDPYTPKEEWEEKLNSLFVQYEEGHQWFNTLKIQVRNLLHSHAEALRREEGEKNRTVLLEAFNKTLQALTQDQDE